MPLSFAFDGSPPKSMWLGFIVVDAVVLCRGCFVLIIGLEPEKTRTLSDRKILQEMKAYCQQYVHGDNTKVGLIIQKLAPPWPKSVLSTELLLLLIFGGE